MWLCIFYTLKYFEQFDKDVDPYSFADRTDATQQTQKKHLYNISSPRS